MDPGFYATADLFYEENTSGEESAETLSSLKGERSLK
jgi:hypothetical protein